MKNNSFGRVIGVCGCPKTGKTLTARILSRLEPTSIVIRYNDNHKKVQKIFQKLVRGMGYVPGKEEHPTYGNTYAEALEDIRYTHSDIEDKARESFAYEVARLARRHKLVVIDGVVGYSMLHQCQQDERLPVLELWNIWTEAPTYGPDPFFHRKSCKFIEDNRFDADRIVNRSYLQSAGSSLLS